MPGTEEEATDLQAFARQLRRVNGEINRLVHGFALARGLHPTDVQALAVILDSEEPLTPGRLGARLGLTSGAVTACLDRLERSGQVRRSRASDDRRVVHVHYVADAKQAAREHFRPLARVTERVRERFDEAELAVVARFLRELGEELGGLPAPRR
ncbi:MarR family winged helix-turn-helix transcriptional regulator [Streptomyces triticirhizae]|uniref:MarR family transcriptional regulator n=1 Tax=Streptomyces triticirhizae TaxID=2483353 RepID=A0A3M2LM44_9ACTN|nr:MarR family winged helix-turn-helix transcriptional regulator [Streptomyces triticirhizae]RMI37890.1 MarR family transcriptional regulator [Streptomyces triticirhizae]